ncbi:MAG: hypothetical protein QXS54_02935 [Candidatus Methanomethylicaceae archaeon]
MQLKIEKVLANVIPDGAGAAPTGRVITHGVEWVENGTLDGVPVRIYYLLSEEDSDMEWGLIDFSSSVDRIEVDVYRCDLEHVPDSLIEAVLAKYG